jgi:hypothetical protein
MRVSLHMGMIWESGVEWRNKYMGDYWFTDASLHFNRFGRISS